MAAWGQTRGKQRARGARQSIVVAESLSGPSRLPLRAAWRPALTALPIVGSLPEGRHRQNGDVAGSSQLITVRFGAPVEGIDPSDGELFLATRHRVAAVYVRQDRSETLFINDEGEVVARWATRLIRHIGWADEAGRADEPRPSVGTLEWRGHVQERHPRAYQRWTPEEDAELTEQFRAGSTVAEMANLHDRRRGGITARLVRLGLIEADTPEGEIGRPQGPTPGRPDEATTAVVATMVPHPPGPAAAIPVVEVSEDVCRHDLPLGTCSICKYDDRPPVYITGGGVRFHARSDCPALVEGQRHVDARGGITEPIEMVHRGSERLEGRDPCLFCSPA